LAEGQRCWTPTWHFSKVLIYNPNNLERIMVMQRSLVSALLFSVILGLSACSKEEPEGTAEKLGKQIDEAAESAQQQTAEARAELGAAMEEKGKELQEEAEKSGR
jgi:hypothetical protein